MCLKQVSNRALAIFSLYPKGVVDKVIHAEANA